MDIIYFIICLFFNYFLIKTFIVVANKYKIVSISDYRSSHKGEVVSGAGFVFVFVFIFLFKTNIETFSLSLLLSFSSVLALFFVSFLDDILDLKFYYKLFFQVLFLSLLIFFSGFGVIYCFLLLLMFFININVSNFMDGINGMSFLYFLVSFISFLFIHFMLNDITLASYSLENVRKFYIIIFSCLISFGFFNFREKAICFLGDVGSISLGVIFSGCVVYYLSCLELQTIYGYLVIRHPYLIFLFFFIYYLDVFATLFKRLLRKENIFKPHRKHLYQFLANNYFKSHVKTSCLYAFLQITINIIVISVMFSQNILLSNYMLYILCFYICLIIFSYFYIQKKIVKENS